MPWSRSKLRLTPSANDSASTDHNPGAEQIHAFYDDINAGERGVPGSRNKRRLAPSAKDGASTDRNPGAEQIHSLKN